MAAAGVAASTAKAPEVPWRTILARADSPISSPAPPSIRLAVPSSAGSAVATWRRAPSSAMTSTMHTSPISGSAMPASRSTISA